MLILAGAVAMTKFQRVYEAAILRTLGASTRMLGAMLALEYGGLGLLAGAVGAAGALALTWAVSRHVLDIPWRPAPGLAALGALATTTLVGIVGVASSYDVLRKKPLGDAEGRMSRSSRSELRHSELQERREVVIATGAERIRSAVRAHAGDGKMMSYRGGRRPQSRGSPGRQYGYVDLQGSAAAKAR